MIQAKRMSHATFETPDLERQIDYFTQVEDLGYFDPRPWHRDRPQKPKVWSGPSDVWGPRPTPEHLRQRD